MTKRSLHIRPREKYTWYTRVVFVLSVFFNGMLLVHAAINMFPMLRKRFSFRLFECCGRIFRPSAWWYQYSKGFHRLGERWILLRAIVGWFSMLRMLICASVVLAFARDRCCYFLCSVR